MRLSEMRIGEMRLGKMLPNPKKTNSFSGIILSNKIRYVHITNSIYDIMK